MTAFSFPSRRALSCACVLLSASAGTLAAHAIVVRGIVRDILGRPISSSRLQLIRGGQSVASTTTLPDGSFEIRSTETGRFLLLGTSPGMAVEVTQPFYGGTFDVIRRDVTLTLNPVREEITVTATGLPTPIEQTSAAVTLIPDNDLRTRFGISDELRLQPGVSVVQSGGYGGVTSLFVRGGNSDANQVLIDGVPADDVGGRFDFSNVASTAVTGLEVRRGQESVLYGTDALASTLRFDTPRGTSLRPVLTYSGDAGNLHTWRNEATLGGAWKRIDYFGAFNRFDSSNALPSDRYHLVTAAGNLGIQLKGNLSLRGTLRSGTSAVGAPGAFLFYGVSSLATQKDQDLYFSGLLEGTYRGNLHTTARYLGARKREQFYEFGQVGSPVTFAGPGYTYTAYFGNTVTIRGANGTTGTGRAEFLTGTNDRSDAISDRDGVSYASDYRFSPKLSALVGFRFLDEHGAYRYPTYGLTQLADRRDYQYTLQFQGEVLSRLYYSLGGAVQHNTLYGTEGTPRLGLAGYAVRPGLGWFRGSKLRFNFSKGVQEPNLAAQTSSLYNTLVSAGKITAIQQYGLSPIHAERSRTYEGGLDQNIYADRLKLKVSYFHNQFGRQVEYVSSSDLRTYFGIPLGTIAPASYGAYLNSLDYSAQGAESEVQYSAPHHLFFRGGYTYLDARVEKSFSGDVTAVLGGFANENPNYPGVAIGSSSPLVGARPFRRAPHTGFLVAEYAGTKLSGGVTAGLASRSDDSTFLSYLSLAGDNSLLLPNRNLAFGYAKVDANLTYQVRPQLAVFTQLNNLANQKQIGPIGYPSLPFNFRVGLKLRFPAE